MKRALSYITIFLLMLMVFGSGCRKERKQTVFKVEQYIKDWMFFDTASWWVYKEINSGAIDSQYVIQSKFLDFETDIHDKNVPYTKDQKAQVFLNNSYCFQLSSPGGSSNIAKFRNSGITYLRFEPINVGSRHAASGLGYTEIIQIDPHFTLDNINYDTLITLLDNYDLSEHTDSVEYKVFKGVGIISKKNISKNQHWQLIKYHINLNKQ